MIPEEAGPPISPEPEGSLQGETTETSPELGYNSLSIDTNIFYDKGLLAQLDQFAESPFQVVLSEIVDKEMKRHLIERIGDAREALEKGLKKVQQELQIPEGNVTRARKAIFTASSLKGWLMLEVPVQNFATASRIRRHNDCVAAFVELVQAALRDFLVWPA
jgi:hypothetical protein